jgi:hypothetical protein
MCCPNFMNTPLKRPGLNSLLSVPYYECALTSICQQRPKDALCAPQMTLRIGLEPLFIGRVRPSKRTLVIDCPEYGRLCAIPRMCNASFA